MNLKHLVFVACGAVFFSACTATGPTPSPSPAAMMPDTSPLVTMEQTISLDEQNQSGQTGTAVISEGPEGNAVVTLTMTGGSFVEPEPAHVHLGSCPTPGAVKYPLNNVVAGSSVTTLDASYEDLTQATEKLAVNVHKSAKESNVYTACGNIN